MFSPIELEDERLRDMRLRTDTVVALDLALGGCIACPAEWVAVGSASNCYRSDFA
jgi:hypothetical protein